jgi:hypothetical protein
MFSPTAEKIKIFVHIVRNVFVWLGKAGTFGVQNRILPGTGTESFTKPVKHGLSQENRYESDD